MPRAGTRTGASGVSSRPSDPDAAAAVEGPADSNRGRSGGVRPAARGQSAHTVDTGQTAGATRTDGGPGAHVNSLRVAYVDCGTGLCLTHDS